MLYDFYHSLLTDKQRDYMGLYYREDYSLSEIASLSDVSRQAVYDNIKRTEQVLETYEKNLRLYDKFQQRNELLTTLKYSIVNKKDTAHVLSVMEQLEKID